MKRAAAIAALLILLVAAVAAFAQVTGGRPPASGETAAPAQAIVHAGHLIVLRGSMLNVYDLSNLPEAQLVSSVEVPGSPEEARAIATARPRPVRAVATAAGTENAEGKKIYASLDCSKCHRLNGKGGTVGPDLSHEGKQHDAQWIEKKITDPKATKKDSLMPAHKLPADQLHDLGNYLAGLK